MKNKSSNFTYSTQILVGDTGLEPAHPQRQEFLRLPRIPIPTIPHISAGLYFLALAAASADSTTRA